MALGYAAMGEQWGPQELLHFCRLAEEAGFESVMASDHFHPWTPEQGQSPFVWSWLGALGATTQLRMGTGVTPPGYRYHPAIIAQAAATLEVMFPGRFWLGLGAGEALNEHVVGGYWPEAAVRLEILAESIDVIQQLLAGKRVRYQGKHVRCESARLYTRSEVPPPIFIATSGPIQSERTGRSCDGIITVGASDEKLTGLLGRFEAGARSAGKDPTTMPRILQVHVSWAETHEQALDQAIKEWPNGGMRFPKQDIRYPEDFAAMAGMVQEKDFTGRVLITADLDQHIQYLQHFVDLGFTEIYVHQVGRNQRQFLQAYGTHVVPALTWSRGHRSDGQ
ncbi:MAG: TIGR03557 family F420-dependent LLM class oxidoreductase [Herpetosiphon sp.]